MASPSAEFFAALARRGHEPLLEKVSGTVRIDLVDGERTDYWLVSINKGDIGVSNESREADCVVIVDHELFDRIVSGEANAMTLMLRGALEVRGEPKLLLMFQRLFPGPLGQRDQPMSAGYARRQS
jgi:putative sterol carrier protein